MLTGSTFQSRMQLQDNPPGVATWQRHVLLMKTCHKVCDCQYTNITGYAIVNFQQSRWVHNMSRQIMAFMRTTTHLKRATVAPTTHARLQTASVIYKTVRDRLMPYTNNKPHDWPTVLTYCWQQNSIYCCKSSYILGQASCSTAWAAAAAAVTTCSIVVTPCAVHTNMLPSVSVRCHWLHAGFVQLAFPEQPLPCAQFRASQT
jgi:hypothetical protein